jgi:hypothetical protein
MNIYVELTKEFNRGKLRAIICSGQAVVLHRLAVMSKDGDWIICEDEESLNFILNILALYLRTAEKWTAKWPSIEKKLSNMSILNAHRMLTKEAEGVLPFVPKEIEK